MGTQTTRSRPKSAFSRTHLKQSDAESADVKVYFSTARAAAWVDVADEAARHATRPSLPVSEEKLMKLVTQ